MSDLREATVSIDMRGHKQGPFQIGRHVTLGPRWVWYDGDRFLWWTASRWRWLCLRRFYKVHPAIDDATGEPNGSNDE